MAPPARYTFDPSGDLRLLLVKPGDPTSVVDDTPNSNRTTNAIQMIASSRHLMLASPVFKAMLEHGNFLEGRTLASQNQVEVPLPDDDAAAWEVILNIIHCRNRKVPKTVDFDLLTKLAVLIDKYEVHESVEVFVEQWFSEYQDSIPDVYDDKLPAWLCIAWVFNKSAEFKSLTLAAKLGSSQSMHGPSVENLPIPAKVIDDIQNDRVRAFRGIMTLVQKLIARYRSPDLQCASTDEDFRRDCDGMMLGCLEKIAIDSGIKLEPSDLFIESEALDGMVLKTFIDNLLNTKLRSLCDWMNASSYWGDNAHGVLDELHSNVRKLDKSVVGLNINSYKARNKRARR